jgi:hypothetical protein
MATFIKQDYGGRTLQRYNGLLKNNIAEQNNVEKERKE